MMEFPGSKSQLVPFRGPSFIVNPSPTIRVAAGQTKSNRCRWSWCGPKRMQILYNELLTTLIHSNPIKLNQTESNHFFPAGAFLTLPKH
jgi:hypothetical protein